MSSNNIDTNQQSNSKTNEQQPTSNYRRNQSSYNNKPIRKKNFHYFNEKPVFSCLVCCSDFPSSKYRAIFAIGQCNHMVCYYCSTKMRVLCEQNECPICRQELAEVIFTTNKDMKFTKLETKKCIEYNSRYKIYFENELCLSEFHRLQEYRCQICHTNETIYLNLKELEDHLKKKHDLYLCELCVTHLKVFPSERKYYNKKDLFRHKKTGDPDNKSYKGHSSCHLCDTMFFDEDYLLTHLKRDHFYCQFCGTKMFFDNYSSLKKHFYDKHFVCEEGLCRDEEITSAFANKFDLQAHKAQVHGSGKINRAMIVDLDFSSNEQNSTNVQNSYQHRNFYPQNYNPYDYEEEQEGATATQALPTEEDFPQLATSSNLTGASSSNYATMTKNIVSSTKNKPTSFSNKFQTPNSNTEDFPALAPGSTVPSFAQTKLPVKQNHKIPPKKAVTKLTAKANNPHASKSSNQQPSNLKYADIASSFPPLANAAPLNESWSKPLPTFSQDDFPDMPIKIKKTKKKTQYVNVQKEAEEQKRKEEEAKKQQQLENELNGNSEFDQQDQNSQFINPLTNDGKMLTMKVPLGLHNLSNNNNKSFNNNLSRKAPPPGFQSQDNQPTTSTNNTFDMSEINNMAIELINSENNKSANVNRSSRNTNNNNTNDNRSSKNNDSNRDNLNKNLASSAKTGYIYPSNFNDRNENLLKLIREQLRTENKFDHFRTLTDKFIRSHIDGDFYFRKCLELFDKNFLNLIFSELLVLMPHIKKQTEILSAYEKYFNYNKGAMQKRNQSGSKGVWILTNEKIEFLVCPTCQQVLGLNDGSEHMANHNNDPNKNK